MEHCSPDLEKNYFLHLTEQIQAVLKTQNISVLTCSSPELPFFSNLSADNQQGLLRNLEIYLELLIKLDKNKKNFLFVSQPLTLDFLKRVGLTPARDLVEFLENDDLVATYNDKQQMIFLTPNHFQWISYSLEDLLCRSWLELFQRNKLIEQVLIDRGQSLFKNSKGTTIQNLDIPPHTIIEAQSAEKRTATCYSKFYSPLFFNGKVAGMLSANKGALTTSRVLPTP